MAKTIIMLSLLPLAFFSPPVIPLPGDGKGGEVEVGVVGMADVMGMMGDG